jgi:hypothetical protein
MRKILKNIAFLLSISLIAISCDYDETNFASLTNDFDPNSNFYVQFSDASRSLQSAVDASGELIDIETTVDVVLLGPPQSQDVVVDIMVDPSSTIDPSMYNLSSTSVTIPAGETSGSVTLTTNTELMPIEETLKLVMNLDAGANNATAGTVLTYEFFRISFCPLENGASDLVGSYAVTEDVDGFEDPFTASMDGEDFVIAPIGQTFIADFWSEAVVSSGDVKVEIAPNGELTIPRQYVYTTVYDGANYDYEIKGSGFWNTCGEDPVLEITYDIFYPGDEKGLAETYASYLPQPYLKGVFTRN